MPLSEVVLWKQIRRRKLGVKFRRQYAIENRIIDFYCPEKKLGIEIDGESHYINKKKRMDELSDRHLNKKYGIRIIRFLNPDIMSNIAGVIERIQEIIH